MRKLKGETGWYHQRLGNVPLGTCDLCGGAGRYKTTYRNKREVITKCWQCAGTGELKIRLKYNGDYQTGLIPGSFYDLISETENDYVLVNRDKELMQVSKDDFEKTT